jgi:hypothetical protein
MFFKRFRVRERLFSLLNLIVLFCFVDVYVEIVNVNYILQKVEKLSAMLHSIDNKPLNSHVYFADDRFEFMSYLCIMNIDLIGFRCMYFIRLD